MHRRDIDWLWKIHKQAWAENRIPVDWTKNIIFPIYKNGNQTLCEKYRALTVAIKGFTKIAKEKLR